MRNIKLAANLPMKVPEIEDITDSLPKKGSWEAVPNKKWTVKGVWDGKTYLRGFRKPEEITCIVVHHSGPPEGTLVSHANHHANQWGAGIAYHICIDKGRIYQTNDLLSMTYHAGGNNTYTIGIEVNRDLTRSDLTDEERNLLYASILTVKSLFPTINEIKGHKELPTAATACPVTNMDRIRQDITALEEQMQYNSSPTADKVLAFAFAARIDALGTTLKSPVWGAEASRKLMLLSDVMPQLGLSEVTPEGIVKRVTDIYANLKYPQYEAEVMRKLLIGANKAREVGLIS